MVNIVPVDFRRHSRKGWRRPVGYKFAEKDSVVALVASEFPRAALALPIGFVEQSGFFVPVLLTSPVPGRSVVVGPTGQWLVVTYPLLYVLSRSRPAPQQVRIFFALMKAVIWWSTRMIRRRGSSRQMVVCRPQWPPYLSFSVRPTSIAL